MIGQNSRYWVTSILAALVLFLTGDLIFAATVTVNPTQSTVSGSIYATIKEAADNLGAGDAWGDGDDTILVTDDSVHFASATIQLTALDATSTLTVKSASGDSPIVALDNTSVPQRMFQLTDPGTYILEGLTCIGAAGVDAEAAGIRAAIWTDMYDIGEAIDVTIRDMVVTANDGFNTPVLDYSTPYPAGNLGVFGRAIYQGDDPYQGKLKLTVEDCALAYASSYGTVNVGRVASSGSIVPETRTIAFRHCLIARGLTDNVWVWPCGDETTIAFEDCLIWGAGDNAIRLAFDSSGDTPKIHLVHSILDSASGGSLIYADDVFDGTLALDRCTLHGPGTDLIDLVGQKNGEGNYYFTDVIASPIGNVTSLLRLEPDSSGDDSGPAPASINVSNVATDSPYHSSQNPTVKTAFDADYSGAGPLTDDPMFVSTTFDSSYTGIRKWDSTANTLFDVRNPSFLGQGGGGSDLAGGAEHALISTPTPTQTPTSSPTETPTETSTFTSTFTSTPTPTLTATDEPSPTATSTPVFPPFPMGDHIYVTTPDKVMEVDPLNGNRTVISSVSVGMGPGFDGISARMNLANSTTLALLDTGPTGALLKIDIQTGNRTILSDNNGTGNGPMLSGPQCLTLAPDGTIYVGGVFQILEVDPDTGDRTAIMDSSTGTGPDLTFEDLAVDSDSSIIGATINGLFRIDPATGNRSLIADDSIFSTPPITGPKVRAVAIEDNRNILLTISDVGVIRVDPDTGDRALLSAPSQTTLCDVEVEVSGTLLPSEPSSQEFGLSSNSLFRVDPTSGARTIISGPTQGSGPSFAGPPIGPLPESGPFEVVVSESEEEPSSVEEWMFY